MSPLGAGLLAFLGLGLLLHLFAPTEPRTSFTSAERAQIAKMRMRLARSKLFTIQNRGNDR